MTKSPLYDQPSYFTIKGLLALIPIVFVLNIIGCDPLGEDPLVSNPTSTGSEVVGISGVVRDNQGKPVSGATLSLRKQSYIKHPIHDNRPKNADVISDINGQYYFDNVNQGEYLITSLLDSVIGEGKAVSLTKDNGAKSVDLTLDSLGAIQGSIKFFVVHSPYKNFFPKYVQIYGTDYTAELIPSEPKNIRSLRFHKDSLRNYPMEYRFFIPNIPQGKYNLNLSYDGAPSHVAIPIHTEISVKAGTSQAWEMLIRFDLKIRSNSKMSTTRWNFEEDTITVNYKDFPLQIGQKYTCIYNFGDERHSIDGNKLLYKHADWIVNSNILEPVDQNNNYIVNLPLSVVQADSIHRVVYRVEHYGGQITEHAFYLRHANPIQSEAYYQRVFFSVAKRFRVLQCPVTINLFEIITAQYDLFKQYWEEQKRNNPTLYGNLAPYIIPLIEYFSPSQTAALDLYYDDQIISKLYQLPDTSARNRALDSIRLSLESIIGGPVKYSGADSIRKTYGSNHGIPIVIYDSIPKRNLFQTVATRDVILLLKRIKAIQSIDLSLGWFGLGVDHVLVDKKPLFDSYCVSEQLHLKLDSFSLALLDNEPQGVIAFTSHEELRFLNGLLSECEGEHDRAPYLNNPKVVGYFDRYTIENMPLADSVLVSLSVPNTTYKIRKPLPKEPSDVSQSDSILWAEAWDNYYIEKEAVRNYNDSLTIAATIPYIQGISSLINREISQHPMFKTHTISTYFTSVFTKKELDRIMEKYPDLMVEITSDLYEQ